MVEPTYFKNKSLTETCGTEECTFYTTETFLILFPRVNMTAYTEYSKATTREFSGEDISTYDCYGKGGDKLQFGCHPLREKKEGKLLFRVRNNTKH